MTNVTKSIIASRKLASQPLDIALANKAFNDMLTANIAKYKNKLTIEYTNIDVPENGKQIYKMYILARNGIESFKVFNGANDASNLFFTPDTNLKYRTLHDIDHAVNYTKGQGTTKIVDELYLNCLMAKRAYDYAIAENYTLAQSLMIFFTVYHDNVGQVQYYVKHKDFCKDQKENTMLLLSKCKGMTALVNGNVSTANNVYNSYLKQCNVS